jgi:amino acid permease
MKSAVQFTLVEPKLMDGERFDAIEDREKGLRRGLTSAQLSMIAIGGAIGTGLFLGSSFAIGFAGPSVIVSYACAIGSRQCRDGFGSLDSPPSWSR